MSAIFKREIASYFNSPLGYVFLTVFYFFSGLYFNIFVLTENSPKIGNICAGMFMIVLFIVPIITMRLLSEDKRQKTDQALLTSPVSLNSIVYGKYFAAFCVLAIGVSVTLIYAFVMSAFSALNWFEIFGNIVGLLLVGGAMVAVGLFISSLTESQVISAVITFGVFLGIMFIEGQLGSFESESINEIVKFLVGVLKSIINGISFQTRYQEFTQGIFNISNFLYFLSVIVIFNFLTVRIIEKRRWS